MANPEHVAVVRKGAEAIAKWRRAHPDERLDLSGADLTRAYLRGADLREAHLEWANLFGSNLSSANLSEAKLSDARLTAVDLSGAKLNGADLSEVDFSWAKLSGADLSQAVLGYAVVADQDLSQVTGLATVTHWSRSSIGVDTLIASFRGAGNKLTPELHAFFRGAGVPKELLDALHKIVSEIEYYSCFVSYGQPDLEFAKKLCEDLKAKDVDCWFYPHDKTVGEHTQREIAAARRRADKMIVVCSVAGLMRDGLLKEIEDQEDEDPKKLMPVSLDLLWREQNFRVIRGARDLKPLLLLNNYGYFALWESNPERYQKGLEDLLKGLRRPEAKKPRRKKG